MAYCGTPAVCPGFDNMVLIALHAATELGPPLPLLPAGIRGEEDGLDMSYLIKARRDGLVSLWRRMAADLAAEET